MKMLTLAVVLAALALPVAAQSAQQPDARQETPSRSVEQSKASTPSARKANAKAAKAQNKAKQPRKNRRAKREMPVAPKA